MQLWRHRLALSAAEPLGTIQGDRQCSDLLLTVRAGDAPLGHHKCEVDEMPEALCKLVSNHSSGWAKHLTPALEFQLSCGNHDADDAALNSLATAVFNGDPILCLPSKHVAGTTLDGWVFGVSERSHLDMTGSTRLLLALGSVDGTQACAEDGGGWMGGDGCPFMMVPMQLTLQENDHLVRSWTLQRDADASVFVNPTVSVGHCVRMDGRAAALDLASIAAQVLPEGSVVRPMAVLAATTTDRTFDRTSQCPIIDILSHNDIWSCHGGQWYTHLFEDSSVPDSVSPTARPPSTVPQAGFADSSQQYAISRAVNGESFVLRGPPGCGKTQTLSNIAAALIKDGKRVLFVAKMKIALGVFCDKLQSFWASGQDGEAPHILRSHDFCSGRAGDGKIKADNVITNDPRRLQGAAASEMNNWWSDELGESVVRQLLRQGWTVTADQPAALLARREEVPGCVGVKMVKHGERPLFACSVCGKITKSEQPLVKHMQTHDETDEKVVAQQALGSTASSNQLLAEWRQQSDSVLQEQQQVYPSTLSHTDGCTVNRHWQLSS